MDFARKNISAEAGQQGKTPVISSEVLSDENKKNATGNTKTEGKPAERSNINGNTMHVDNTRKEQTEKVSGSGQLADAAGDVEQSDTVEKSNAGENRKDSGTDLAADGSGEYKAGVPWVLPAAILVLGAAAGMILFVRYRRMR